MSGRGGGWGFAVAATAALLVVAAIPGAAHARTDSDARCLGPDRQFLVCTEITSVEHQTTMSIGGPESNQGSSDGGGNPQPISPTEPDQCQPPGTKQTPNGQTLVVGNTQGAEYNNPNGQGNPYWNQDYPWAWQYDYWVDGGYWVLWDGRMSGYYPWNFVNLNGDTGLVSVAISVRNYAWHDIKARVFWVCSPANTAPEGDTSYRSPTTTASGRGATAAVHPGPTGLLRPAGSGEDELQGDSARNPLVGFGGDDELSGGDGEDHLHAGAGDDSLSGGDHADLLHGRRGDDRSLGGDGSDDVLGGKGDDFSHGGDGGDQVFDDQGADHLRGGRGNDRFWAHDGDRDRIDCGPGEDIALIDRRDVASDCEHVYRSEREAPKKLPKI
jgi:hypothetical protein